VKKIVSVLVFLLFILLVFPLNVSAGDEENPEIEDEAENDVVDYLNILSAWFYEEADQPDYLFICMKVIEINDKPSKQHLTVKWEYNGIKCSAGLAIGYGEPCFLYQAGWGHGFWFQEHYQEIEGFVNLETGVITFKIPKVLIKNPQKGDVLTKTYAMTFKRFGFIGRIGFDRAVLRSLIEILIKQNLSDFGPNEGYGKDYIIQY